MEIKVADTTPIKCLKNGQTWVGSVSEWVAWHAMTQDVVLDFALAAYVNEGRWVVDCPFCNSAQLASKLDKRFYCVECGNKAVGGLWITVDWPAEAVAIENVLLERGEVAHMNWTPEESLADLKQENKRHMKTVKVFRREV